MSLIGDLAFSDQRALEQEALNPGSLRRMERRIEKENGQSYLLAPSQTHLDPFGLE